MPSASTIDDGERERRRRAQTSQRVADVEQQIAERLGALGAAELAGVVRAQPASDRVGIAEAGASLLAGGFRVQAGGDEVALEPLEVEADLVVDVGRDVGSEEAQVAAPARRFARSVVSLRAHRPTPPMTAGSASSTRSTARAKRVQLPPCTSRCFSPARLIA